MTNTPITQTPLATQLPPALPPISGISPLPEAIAAYIKGYGASTNIGIARRQQRTLALVLSGYYVAQEMTFTSEGCPVVTRFEVRSSEGEQHYRVTRIPNERTCCYACNCPDTWMPCKHAYGAMLIQQGLLFAHPYRFEMDTYRALLLAADHHTLHTADERTALHVLLNITAGYDALAQEAARQFYTAGKSYAATCFSAFLDKVKWAHGAGYGGIMVGQGGCIQSVLPERPYLVVRWHPLELRWYVVTPDGSEDVPATDAVLYPDIPDWAIARAILEEDEPQEMRGGFEPEDMEGHYALP